MWFFMVALRARSGRPRPRPGRPAPAAPARKPPAQLPGPPRAVDIEHPRLGPVPAHHPGVGDLSSALGVERAFLQLGQRSAVLGSDREKAGLGAQLLVADEPGRRRLGGESEDGSMAVLGAMGARGPHPRSFALLLHQLLKALVVDREALLGEEFLGQVVGKAVGIVEAGRRRRRRSTRSPPPSPGRPALRSAGCHDQGCGRSSPPRRGPSARPSRSRRRARDMPGRAARGRAPRTCP